MSLKNILHNCGCNSNDIDSLSKLGIISTVQFLAQDNIKELSYKSDISLTVLDKVKESIFAGFIHYPLQGISLYNHILDMSQLIPSGCHKLDAILRGGLNVREMTELFGQPATGKTQLCLSIVVNTCLSLQHSVIYMDTVSCFFGKRLLQIMKTSNPQASDLSLKSACSKVKCIKSFNIFDLLANLETIRNYLQSQNLDEFYKNVKLIVVDSVTSVITPYLGGKQSQGHALMTRLGMLLKQISHEFRIPTLVVNNAIANYSQNSFYLQDYKPALGTTWLSVPSVRLQLSHCTETNAGKSSQRQITLVKHTRISTGLSAILNLTNAGFLE